MFVLDEADRMLDMGFIHDMRKIVAKLPARAADAAVLGDHAEPTSAELADAIARATRCRSHRRRVDGDGRTDRAVGVLRRPASTSRGCSRTSLNHAPSTRALVFTRTKHGADKVVQGTCAQRAFRPRPSTATRARSRASARWPASSPQRPPVLVATDIAARGLDVDDDLARHQLRHAARPREPTSTASAAPAGPGASGSAVSFCDREERPYLKAIERLIRKAIEVDRDHPPTGLGPAPARQQNPTAETAGRRNNAEIPSREPGQASPAGRKRPHRLEIGHADRSHLAPAQCKNSLVSLPRKRGSALAVSQTPPAYAGGSLLMRPPATTSGRRSRAAA